MSLNEANLMKVKWIKRLILSLGLFGAGGVTAVLSYFVSSTISLIAIGATYVGIILLIDKFLEAHRRQFWLIPLVYCGLTLYLAVLFVIAMDMSDIKLNVISEPETFDYLYFAIISLTSVGYGDLTALDDMGKKVSIGMALLGSAHMLVSVALFIDKLNSSNSRIES